MAISPPSRRSPPVTGGHGRATHTRPRMPHMATPVHHCPHPACLHTLTHSLLVAGCSFRKQTRAILIFTRVGYLATQQITIARWPSQAPPGASSDNVSPSASTRGRHPHGPMGLNADRHRDRTFSTSASPPLDLSPPPPTDRDRCDAHPADMHRECRPAASLPAKHSRPPLSDLHALPFPTFRIFPTVAMLRAITPYIP